jgi:hypothetical protein
MLKSIKISLKDTIIYGLGNIAVKIVGLVLIPVFTDPKFFSTDQYGIIGILEIFGIVLTAFLASGLPQSLTRWFWDPDHKDNQKGIYVYFNSDFCFIAVLPRIDSPFRNFISSYVFRTNMVKGNNFHDLGICHSVNE